MTNQGAPNLQHDTNLTDLLFFRFSCDLNGFYFSTLTHDYNFFYLKSGKQFVYYQASTFIVQSVEYSKNHIFLFPVLILDYLRNKYFILRDRP